MGVAGLLRRGEPVPTERRHVRTDLAVEAKDALGGQLPGVDTVEETREEGVAITRVGVTPEGAEHLGKAPGRYVTIGSRRLRQHDPEHATLVGRILRDELQKFFQPRPESVLVVGLGNWHATADALGPKVVARVLVTRHLRSLLPEAERAGLSAVAAFSPGVLGITGVETAEVVEGLVDRIGPDLVVAVDALAALDVARILTTIQITDTGISPGSGVGARRPSLTRERLGCGVVAIGVPTVVHATTIAEEAISRLTEEDLGDAERARLAEMFGELVVTPKEIDRQVADLSRLIAGALNSALHPEVDLGEWSLFA